MTAPRFERVQRQLLRETTAVLIEDLKDPRIGFVTVTHTELTPDLRHANIFVSILGNAVEREETFQVLSKATGFIRTQIGHRMRLRFVPEIEFMKDETGEHVNRIFQILNEINTKKKANGDSSPGR